ncbi:MAG: hypothetical protein AAF682_02100 [Planctomycetota bacterium]
MLRSLALQSASGAVLFGLVPFLLWPSKPQAGVILIDFEDMGLAPGQTIDPPDLVGIETGAYRFEPIPRTEIKDLHVGNDVSFWSNNGTTVLAGHDSMRMTRVDGGPFDLLSFELAGWPTDNEIPFAVYANTGTSAVFVPDGTTDGPGGVADFETFTLLGFEGVQSVLFVHTGPGAVAGIFHLDNLVVREGGAPASPPSTVNPADPVEQY